MILEASQEGGHIDEVEQTLMRRALTFGDRTVSDIMVPRTETAFLPTSSTVSEAIDEVEETNHTRYPVFEEDVDNIVGYVHVKDLYRAPRTGTLRRLLRPIGFIAETANIEVALQRFQSTRTPLAIVVDEHGGTAGIVTIQDVVEELIGEVQDEFDLEAPPVEPQRDGSYSVDGSARVDYLEDDSGHASCRKRASPPSAAGCSSSCSAARRWATRCGWATSTPGSPRWTACASPGCCSPGWRPDEAEQNGAGGSREPPSAPTTAGSDDGADRHPDPPRFRRPPGQHRQDRPGGGHPRPLPAAGGRGAGLLRGADPARGDAQRVLPHLPQRGPAHRRVPDHPAAQLELLRALRRPRPSCSRCSPSWCSTCSTPRSPPSRPRCCSGSSSPGARPRLAGPHSDAYDEPLRTVAETLCRELPLRPFAFLERDTLLHNLVRQAAKRPALAPAFSAPLPLAAAAGLPPAGRAAAPARRGPCPARPSSPTRRPWPTVSPSSPPKPWPS